MKRGMRARLLMGFGANASGQVIVAVIQLAGVPILLHYWGGQLYGEWLILFAIPAYLSIMDLGFSQSAGNDMTARVARGERSQALEVFQSLIAFVFLAAGVSLVLMSFLVFVIPLDRWGSLTAMTTIEVRWVLWLLTAAVLIQLTEGISHAGFRANGDYPLQRAIAYLTLLLQFTGIWLAAAAGWGPVAAAAAFFIVRAAVTPLVGYLLARRHPWLRFGIGNARAAQLRALFRPALANSAFPTAQALSTQGMVLVVGATLGPLAVVTFSTLRTLTRISLQLVLAASHAAEPELATAYGSGDRSLLRSLYQHTLRASLWLSFGSALFLAAAGGWILDIWTQGKVGMDYALFTLLLFTSVASVLWYGALTTLRATNRHLRASVVYLVTAAGTVALSAVLLSSTGILAAVGLSLLLADCILLVYGLRAVSRLCGDTALGGLRATINPAPLLKLVSLKGHDH